MTPIYAGLPINTPHGIGVVESIRNDGMIVTRLAGTTTAGTAAAGGPGYIGYFHPSSVCVAPSPSSLYAPAKASPLSPPSPFAGGGSGGGGGGFIGGVNGGGGARKGSSFLPSAAAVLPPGMFKPVSPGMRFGGGGATSAAAVHAANQPATSMLPPSLQAQRLEQQAVRIRRQQLEQRQAADRPFASTPPPSKRRRSAEGGFTFHH
ncbi:unnamed protein product [Ectocarpus sp. 13 AM-2016]